MVKVKRLSQKARATQFVRRLQAGVLSIALLALQPEPAKALYHCRVSGATLSECCCKGVSSCCDKRAVSERSCCSEDTESTDSQTKFPSPQGVSTPAACGCCDITYQGGIPISDAISGSRTETSSRKSLESVAAVPAAVHTLKWAAESLKLPRVGRYLTPVEGPPLYILYASFLL